SMTSRVNRRWGMAVGRGLPPGCPGGWASLTADTCAVWRLGRFRARRGWSKTRRHHPGFQRGTADTSSGILPANWAGNDRIGVKRLIFQTRDVKEALASAPEGFLGSGV